MQSQLLVDGKSFAIWAWGGGGLDSTSTSHLNCIDISTIPSLTYFMSVDFNPIWVLNPNLWKQSLWWSNHESYLHGNQVRSWLLFLSGDYNPRQVLHWGNQKCLIPHTCPERIFPSSALCLHPQDLDEAIIWPATLTQKNSLRQQSGWIGICPQFLILR